MTTYTTTIHTPEIGKVRVREERRDRDRVNFQARFVQDTGREFGAQMDALISEGDENGKTGNTARQWAIARVLGELIETVTREVPRVARL